MAATDASQKLSRLPLLPGSFYRFRLRFLTTLVAVLAIPARNVSGAHSSILVPMIGNGSGDDAARQENQHHHEHGCPSHCGKTTPPPRTATSCREPRTSTTQPVVGAEWEEVVEVCSWTCLRLACMTDERFARTRRRDPSPRGGGSARIPCRCEDGAAGVAVHDTDSAEPLRGPGRACRSLRPPLAASSFHARRGQRRGLDDDPRARGISSRWSAISSRIDRGFLPVKAR